MKNGPHPKKSAKNILDKFKKFLVELCLKEDATLVETMDKLDGFWNGNLIDDIVKKNIVRLVGEESMLLKLIFNHMPAFRYPIPQKKWFLGSAHSLEELRRQPCNAPEFSCHTIGLLGNLGRDDQIVLSAFPFAIAAPHKMEVSKDGFKLVLQCNTIYIVINIMFQNNGFGIQMNFRPITEETPEQFNSMTPYEQRTKYVWCQQLLELEEDGKIHHGENEQVLIYLNDEKINNEKVIQWALHGNDVILLFDTFFTAYGTIRKGKSGLVIECNEMAGTYPTGEFAVSTDFKFFARRSPFIPDAPDCTVKITEERFKAALQQLDGYYQNRPFLFSHAVCEQVQRNGRPGYEKNRQGYLSDFCADIHLLFDALSKMESDGGHFLSAKEVLICNTKSCLPEDPANHASMDCTKAGGECSQMKKLIEFAKDQIAIRGVNPELNVRDKEVMAIMTHMIEYFLKVLVYGIAYEEPVFKHWRARREDRDLQWVHKVKRCAYFPLEIYELLNDPNSLGVSAECMTKRCLQGNSVYSDRPGAAAILVFHRPDILFFGTRMFHMPIQFLRKFAEIYERRAANKAIGVNNDEALVREFCTWAGRLETPITVAAHQHAELL